MKKFFDRLPIISCSPNTKSTFLAKNFFRSNCLEFFIFYLLTFYVLTCSILTFDTYLFKDIYLQDLFFIIFFISLLKSNINIKKWYIFTCFILIFRLLFKARSAGTTKILKYIKYTYIYIQYTIIYTYFFTTYFFILTFAGSAKRYKRYK